MGRNGPAATSEVATKLDAPYIMLSIQWETETGGHDDEAEALPLVSDSTNKNAADDKAYGANDGTLQQVEATYRAQKVATTVSNSQPAYRPKNEGVHAIRKQSQHTKSPAALDERKTIVRYMLTASDDDSNSKEELEQTRNADGGFQLTRYLASPKSVKAKGVKKALRAHRESPSLRDHEALQNLYKEQLAQGATTAEALTLIERMKGNSGAPGEALSEKMNRPQLRISKYASPSTRGKAMERHERGQLSSTKFAT